MRFIEIQKSLRKLRVFSTIDLKNIDDKYDKSKITKWKKLGYIKSIIKGYYIVSDINLNQNLLFEIANRIYNPSYISLEMAFSYYSIIPEQTFNITSVSTKKTIFFQTEIGYFDYKKIKSDLFWGYGVVKIGENKFLLAELEKAIIDYLYLNNNISSLEDFELLRWNKYILKEKLDFDKLKKYAEIINKTTLSNRVKLLFKYIEND